MIDAIRAFSKDKHLISERRRHIARCAARVLVSKGYDRTSVREIAKACGMSMGALYHYIGSKEDVLYLVIDSGLSEFLSFVLAILPELEGRDPIEALEQCMKTFYQAVDDSQDFMLFAHQETKNIRPEARHRIFELDRHILRVFENLLDKGCKSGEFKIDDILMISNYIVSMGLMWAVRRWFLRKHYTLDEYTRQHTELILRMIAAPEVLVKRDAMAGR
jgi:AcrR family transcriptional regulator